jgi:hypothetical protein
MSWCAAAVGSATSGSSTAAIAVVTLVLLWKTRLNNAWFIAGGAAIGIAHTLLG